MKFKVKPESVPLADLQAPDTEGHETTFYCMDVESGAEQQQINLNVLMILSVILCILISDQYKW